MGGEVTKTPVGVVGRIGIGLLLAAIGFVSFGWLIWAWSVVEETTAAPETPRTVEVLGVTFKVSGEIALFILVAAAASIGSFIHSAESFVTFSGNRTLVRSWVPWYLFRTLIGISLAVIVYLLVRAGFFANAAGAEEVSPFGVAAIAGMAGLFSRPATTKLREVFDLIFKVSDKYSDERLSDKAEVGAVAIDSLAPQSVERGAEGQEVVVNGRGFVEGCSVRVDDATYAVTIASPLRLTFTLAAAQTATEGMRAVVVVDPDGARTRSMPLRVAAPRSSAGAAG